jgi:uncharacterized protein YjbI with pentapeptide repeats
MACCNAESFEWCKDLETVYTDEEGKDYCVFHALKGHKGVSVEEFNNLIFQRIEEAKNSGQKCNLSATIFEGPIKFNQFDEKNPLPDIDFSFTIFTENAYFFSVTFSGYADFKNTTFKSNADFILVTFDGKASFINATFNKSSRFESTIFKNRTNFDGVDFKGKLNFNLTTFDGPVFFVGNAEIWNIFINSKLIRTYVKPKSNEPSPTFRKNASFRKTTFTKEAAFWGCLTEGIIRFEEVDLSRVSFLESNLRNFNFVRCIWHRKKGRDVLYDEVQIKSPEDKKAFEQVENLYRQLKQKYKKELNEPEVSNWHYGEKEMFRKKSMLRRYNPLSFSNLYWAFSGYGECPVRAGIMLLLLLIFIMTGMNYFGLIPFGNEKSFFGFTEINGFSGSFDWEKFKLLVFNTIQYTLFFKTPFFKPETINGYIFQTIFTRLLIPIQATLFAFALRNKFRR